ncbi:MAG: hypothetical protein KIT27_10115 [Legionellales bacterium]|nr:hypothetical protein [Legionellales bacterium]
MQLLTHWFQKHKNKSSDFSLDNAILTNRFFNYALYRLRFLIANFFLDTVLHVIEFFFLIKVFPVAIVIFLIMLRASSLIVNGFWWGGLEISRARIRMLRKTANDYQLRSEISLWLGFSIYLGVLLVGLSVLILYFGAHFLKQYFSSASLYILAIAVQMSASLIVRTYHSGVYALQRVYRPFWSIAFSSIANFIILFSLWPFVKFLALPIAILVSSLLSCGLTAYFASLSYKNLKIDIKVNLNGLKIFSFLKKVISLEFFCAGLASTMIKFDGIIVLLFYKNTSAQTSAMNNIIILFLITIPIRFGYDWAKLFYFDFKKLHQPLFSRIRNRFCQSALLFSGIPGIISVLIMLILFLIAYGHATLFFAILMLPFFMLRSLLAILQMKAFTEHRYLDVLACGSITAGIVLIVNLAGLSMASGFILFSLFLLACCFYLFFPILPLIIDEGNFVGSQPLVVWGQEIVNQPHPVAVKIIRLHGHLNLQQRIIILNKISHMLGGAGLASRLSEREIIWFEKINQQPTRITLAWLTHNLLGCVERFIMDAEFSAPRVALETVFDRLSVEKNYPSSLHDANNMPIEPAELIDMFLQQFPEGYYYDFIHGTGNLTQQHSAQFGALKRGINFLYQSNLNTPGQYYYGSFVHNSELTLLFMVPKRYRQAQPWLKQLWYHNLRQL